MNLRESLRVALRGLVSNKMRTALTMLGVIIGVAVVILVVAIGQGAAKAVTDAVNSLGTNLLTVKGGRARIRINAATAHAATANAVAAPGSKTRLSLEEARLIAHNFKQTIEALAPQVKSKVQIRLGNKDSTTSVTGTTIDEGWEIEARVSREWEGPGFDPASIESRRMKIVERGRTQIQT